MYLSPPLSLLTQRRYALSFVAHQLVLTQELGFTGENGYQAFLYPNEADMRKLLGWLVGRLPKPDEEEAAEVAGPLSELNKQIVASLKVTPLSYVFDCLSLPSSHVRLSSLCILSVVSLVGAAYNSP